jgi:hypothetical protein
MRVLDPEGREVHPLGRGRLAAVSFDGGTTRLSVVEKMLNVGATFDYRSRSLLKVRLYSL